MRRLATAAAAILGAAAAAGPAHAGGWATVGLAPLPGRLDPGEPWTVRLRILQHGVTPLEGVRPAVVIRPARPGGDVERRRFAARPAGAPGVYRAEVVFPAAGRWAVEVDDGFTATPHGFPAAVIGGRAAPPAPASPTAAVPGDDGAWTAVTVAGAAVAGLAAAGGIALGARRRPARQRATRSSPRTSAR